MDGVTMDGVTRDGRLRGAAFAIPGDPRQRTGGYRYEWRLLEELRAQGRNIRYIALPPPVPEPGTADRAVIADALEALPADEPLILDGLVFGAYPTEALARLRAPVVAMLHHPMGLEHGLPPDLAARLLAQEAANLALATQIVVTSPHTRDHYIGMGADPARVTVALPGIDRPLPAFPEDRAGADGGVPILAVGLLAPRKGHDILIDALTRIAGLDWTARIVGKSFDPAYEARLRRQIGEAGLSPRVELAGELGDAELEAEWQRAGIFALATRHEGYGMALAEALAWGLPIVTCAAGAVPGTVGEAARLVPPEDPEALAGALAGLIGSRAERASLARLAAARAAKLPDWTETARIVGGVLDRIA